MTGQTTGHRFAGIQVEQNIPPLPNRYRGTCACGHQGEWTPDKDQAWDDITDHYLPVLRQAVIDMQVLRVCTWCRYGRCRDCAELTVLAGGSACICKHPDL